jgi:hydrogenase expression/formation protein HypC
VCLAVPGRIESVFEEAGLRMARVDFGGVRQRVCLETLPEAAAGAWVLVHAGVALQTLDPRAAAESLRLLAQAARALETES